MIVDTSAVIAILAGEAEAQRFTDALAGEAPRSISSATVVELFVVADRARNPAARHKVDAILRDSGIVVAPFTAEHALIARQAHRDFGRGSGHPARLNMGDCFSYALAKATNEPLLYKGADFGHTDVRNALDEFERDARG